jgi:phosphoglycolate phosphatase-like HAD superfamily hydrolase
MNTVLLFDIDGTLIRSGGAGKVAMEQGLRSAFGLRNINDTVAYSGRTDFAIARDLLATHGLEPSIENQRRLTDAYLECLPDSLRSTPGTICQGIEPLLERLAEREDVLLGLLTGNIRRGAEIKLGHFGLWHPFALGGFGDHRHDRDDVARAAWSAVQERVDVEPQQVWVIGDTPLDVSCARAINARVIAVATGWHDLAELQATQPDYALADLANVDEVLKIWF